MQADQPGQSPHEAGAADFLAWRHCLSEVLAPHMVAGGAPVASAFDEQDGGPPPEGCVGDSSGNCILR